MVRRRAFELGRAGIDGLEGGHHAERLAARAHDDFARAGQVRDLHVGQAIALRDPERVGVDVVDGHPAQRLLHGDDIGHARQEEQVDARRRVHFRRRPAAPQRATDVHDAVARRTREQRLVTFLGIRCRRMPVGAKARAAVLERAQRLAERFFERAADGHDLAHRLHAGGKRVVGILELLERETRRLHDAVVDRRLEAGRRGARDVVYDLGQRVADRQARRRLRDGKARRLRRERRRARHARVHLDDHHAAVCRIHGELNVAAAGLNADLLEHRERRRAHALVFHVSQRLRGRHGDRIARVHAHRVEVLDRAHDDAVAGGIAHDLHLELFPTLDRFFHEHFAGG